MNEIIQTKTEELYTISSEYLLNGINVTNIIVPKFIYKSESDLQTRPSSATSDEDEYLEDKKSQYYRKISDEICPKILKIIGSKPLNFIIWSSDEHMSLIAKCMNIFYFLDSCGYYFQRFPLCDNKYFQLGRDTFYIESQIQADEFSCGSYCLEFAKKLTEKFLILKKNQKNFNEYIKQFFTNEDGSEFHNRFALKIGGEERTFGLLPSELLIYFQSFKFLNNIEDYLTNGIKEELEKLEQREEKLLNEQNETKSRIIELERALDSKKYQEFSEKIKTLKQSLQNKIKLKNNIRKQIAELNKEIPDYKKQLGELNSKMQDCEEQLKNIRKDLKLANDDFTKMPEEELKELNKEIQDYEEQLKEIRKEKQDKESQISEISKKIKSVQKEILQKLPKEQIDENYLIAQARKEHLNLLKSLSPIDTTITNISPKTNNLSVEQTEILDITKFF